LFSDSKHLGCPIQTPTILHGICIEKQGKQLSIALTQVKATVQKYIIEKHVHSYFMCVILIQEKKLCNNIIEIKQSLLAYLNDHQEFGKLEW
jgi:hypothetical protein